MSDSGDQGVVDMKLTKKRKLKKEAKKKAKLAKLDKLKERKLQPITYPAGVATAVLPQNQAFPFSAVSNLRIDEDGDEIVSVHWRTTECKVKDLEEAEEMMTELREKTAAANDKGEDASKVKVKCANN